HRHGTAVPVVQPPLLHPAAGAGRGRPGTGMEPGDGCPDVPLQPRLATFDGEAWPAADGEVLAAAKRGPWGVAAGSTHPRWQAAGQPAGETTMIGRAVLACGLLAAVAGCAGSQAESGQAALPDWSGIWIAADTDIDIS